VRSAGTWIACLLERPRRSPGPEGGEAVRTSNPHQEQHRRERLAEVIDRRREDIELRWLERVQRNIIEGQELSPTELRKGMPIYLNRLADGLRGSGSAEAGGTSSWENVAREHAETRVHLGLNIGQLVQEFIVLRQVLFEIIREEHMLIDIDQASQLADLIEGAISAAVASYVEYRDYELRKQQAEHVGFITHELRNPLTTATLGLVHLRRSLSLTPEQERAFSIVERKHHRLAEIIDGVLMVEHDVHLLKPKLTVLTLAQVLEDVVAAAKLAAEAKGLHFDARFDPDVVVVVDPKLTRSAIENVVGNALKFTDTGDVHVVAEDVAGEVVIHVRDSCPGISKEDLRTIFEPFRRGHTRKPGAGLGLAIARRAMEAQGGTIRAEPGEDKGCHFSLTLPKPRH
jgi:signal transduction histidine kinase